MKNFQVGDVVKLNSGGPLMTVSDVESIQTEMGQSLIVITCQWFDSNNELKQGEFDSDELTSNN